MTESNSLVTVANGNRANLLTLKRFYLAIRHKLIWAMVVTQW